MILCLNHFNPTSLSTPVVFIKITWNKFWFYSNPSTFLNLSRQYFPSLNKNALSSHILSRISESSFFTIPILSNCLFQHFLTFLYQSPPPFLPIYFCCCLPPILSWYLHSNPPVNQTNLARDKRITAAFDEILAALESISPRFVLISFTSN